MSAVVLAGSSLLAVVLAMALAREIRLRRALQSLLRRLLAHWRPHETIHSDDLDRPAAGRLQRSHTMEIP
jgi:hypothetical protein